MTTHPTDEQIAEIELRWESRAWPEIGYFVHGQAWDDIQTLLGFARDRNRLEAVNRELVEALKLAKSNIEHMAKFIGAQRLGYSFESLGEDMPGINAALRNAEQGGEHT